MRCFLFILPFLVLLSCVSSRTEKEFNEKRPDVVLIIGQANAVEKKTAINVLVPEYINASPKDSLLLAIFNSYLLYYLDDLGYKKLVIRNQNFYPDPFKTTEQIFSIQTNTLAFKEFKHKETATDGTNSKVVKMRGIEVNPSTLIAFGTDVPNPADKQAMTAKANALKEETQEGQFKQTVGIKDMVNGNNQGSVKYVYNVQHLEDGVFQNLCIESAASLAREIDFTLKRIYQKRQKAKK
jgi:hypothetical protein